MLLCKGSMPLMSPDLVRSYASPAETDADCQRLLQRGEALRGLAGIPQERVARGRGCTAADCHSDRG